MSRNPPGRICGAVIASVAVSTTTPAAAQGPPSAPASQTQIVLLGTGNPVPDPDRSGPATAVVVNGTPYLVDLGAGVVRRAKAAVVDKGPGAAEPPGRLRDPPALRPYDRICGPDPHSLDVWTARAVGSLRATGNQGDDLMNHADGWMSGWMGGGMWLWPVIGVLLVVLLVVVINKVSKRGS